MNFKATFFLFLCIPSLTIAQAIVGLKSQDYVNKLRHKAVLKITIFDKELNEVSVGSGFYLGRSGLILTNFHVLRDFLNKTDHKIQIQDKSGKRLESLTILNCNSSEQKDLCLLKSKPSKYYFPATGSKIGRGHQLTLIGHCGKKDFNIKEGKVIEYYKSTNNKFKLKYNELNYRTDLIQTSANQCPGDSGGPFYSSQGALLGIASIVFTNNSSSKEYNIGITNNEILSFIKRKSNPKKVLNERIIKETKSEAKLMKFLE